MVDYDGADTYNVGTELVISTVLGAGSDLAVGVFVDKGGDDVYRVPNSSGGTGSLNGAGIFFDLAGADTHAAVGVTTWGHALLGPTGAGADNPRRGVPTYGIFVDAGAEQDTYTRSDLDQHPSIGNDGQWTQLSDPELDTELGMGVDGAGATGFE
jgi:hypothetical protein